MSMNSPVAPESMRALTDIGVLLTMVLSHKGILVPLCSVAEHTRKGSSEGWSVFFFRNDLFSFQFRHSR